MPSDMRSFGSFGSPCTGCRGAAGYFAAIRAAELGARVTLFEANKEPLGKVRISGGTLAFAPSTAPHAPHALMPLMPAHDKCVGPLFQAHLIHRLACDVGVAGVATF